MSRRKGAHNRGATVITLSHPECRACYLLREKLDAQIVENGRWRLLILDLKTALSQTGGKVEHRPYHPTGDHEPDDGAECAHGVALSAPCCHPCGRCTR